MTTDTTPPLFPWQSNERIALFIDGTSLYASTKSLGFDIDYSRLLDHFGKSARLVRAFYYTTIYEGQDYNPVRPLADWLDYNGYTLVAKYAREFTDSQGRKRTKHSVAIDIAVDMMEIAPHIDHAVLFSGDGDFKRLIDAVQRKGVQTTVISTAHSHSPMIADDLRRKVDHFIDLDTLKGHLEKNKDTHQHPPHPDIHMDHDGPMMSSTTTTHERTLPGRYQPRNADK